MAGASQESRERLRWRLADESEGPQQALFEQEAPTWRAGHGEFRGLEFLDLVFFSDEDVATMDPGAVNEAQGKLVEIWNKAKAASGA